MFKLIFIIPYFLIQFPPLNSFRTCMYYDQRSQYTVNIYRQKTILAKGNTDEIPTTCKSFSLYLEFLQRIQVIYQQTVIYLQPLQVNYHLLVNYPQTLKEFQVQAKGFAGCGNFICISFSQYSFLPIDIYSACKKSQKKFENKFGLRHFFS